MGSSPAKRRSSRYLAGPDDEAVLVLVLELFGVVQLLPAHAHGHHAQLVVRAEVVGVLCREAKAKQGGLEIRCGADLGTRNPPPPQSSFGSDVREMHRRG